MYVHVYMFICLYVWKRVVVSRVVTCLARDLIEYD